MNSKLIFFLSLLVLCISVAGAQTVLHPPQPNKENIPRSTIPEHKWWNLLYYAIDITPDYDAKFVRGTNCLQFQALQTGKVMQIDLQQPMRITSITWNGAAVQFKRRNDAYLINFSQYINKGETETMIIHFEGHPKVAIRPPWDNGWIWATDNKGRPWMSIACEGTGADIWLPCKNVLYDEPDKGTSFTITVPDTLVAVANGRLQKETHNKNRTATYTWKVVNPINNYNIIPYIGKYVSWHENYPGVKGNLDCDYWVLDYDLDKAKKHFKQTDTMLHCFEYWLGAYPFYEDSYKLVEAPMPGMEHQSAIAYGNGFENGYSGKNLSGTEWGLKWDFILVHESGHEWFGNSITASNNGEAWIHEGFTKYLETIYTGCLFGTEAGNDYAIGIWKRIKNDEPVLGSGSSDQYNKSSAMLHMIRQIIGDTLFRSLLQALNKTFYHQTVSSEQIFHFINTYTHHDLTKVFNQYLRTTQVPLLEYSLQKNIFKFRWSNCVDGFNMPVKISIDPEKYIFIYPTTQWKNLSVATDVSKDLTVNRNFYIEVKNADIHN